MIQNFSIYGLWYLNGTNSQSTSMQISLIPKTLFNLPNHQKSINDWCEVRILTVIYMQGDTRV